jgi:hypothetical protein
VVIDTTATRHHAKSLSTKELQEFIAIEKKRINVYLDDLKAMSRKLVVMKHDLRVYEKELNNR